MNDENSFFTQNAGWLVGGLMSLWALTLRVLIGRHFKVIDKVMDKLDAIDRRLSRLEGRSMERKHDQAG